MNYKYSAMNDVLLRKHITAQLDNITCINCCKYYLVPTTAKCGHSLCHTCWRTNRTCPICALQVEKKSLRLNCPLQTLTEHTLLLGKAFQSLFKINLNDITPSDEQQHVKEWLANSSNQFSAPVSSSQPFSEEPIKAIHQVTSDIQIHTSNLRVKEPEREIVQMNVVQDDWDKIEEMPDIENNKILKNAVGPMDIEPFDFYMDDQKYNTHNPRRSSRNKEFKTSNTITNDVSSDKESEKSDNINSNKKSKNLGLNWKNVKRMKKEFSKLNKKNNNKLNVSIEMCKKAKPSANKAATFKTEQTLGLSQHPKDNSVGRAPKIDLAMENNQKIASQNIVDFVEFGTPIEDDDDKSVVEETPQKTTSFLKSKNKNEIPATTDDLVAEHCLMTENNKSTNMTGCHGKDITIEDSANVISISDSAGEITEVRKSALETPLTITKFVDKITHKSTPLARKSLNFSCRNLNNDLEETLCPSSVVAAKTTQEREFMSRAFEQTVESPTHTLHAGKERRRATNLCIAGSCLVSNELAILKQLCLQRNWIFVEKYTKDLTHLVVGVDEENRSQRSVKYICALASAKWIVSFAWVEKCIQLKEIADEEPYEALDAAGEPGPRRSRLAKNRLLQGFTFYCMPPFTIIDIETLKDILEASGGRVVNSAGDVRLKNAPAMLLAEPEHTQEDRFIYLAMELQIVPVNYEWVLNCLGTYTLKPISDLLLCPATLLPPAVNDWPPELILSCDE
ncbi:jg7948 [Pararge aegeria aegeria]|uniref:Jg7948 protein n=1 Tax=Pararge aegeria aegeria TaxID=348720 RepID=A0A8S4SH76_9NEOP|nr:jg7948 [Pararge aegeria aegeria]